MVPLGWSIYFLAKNTTKKNYIRKIKVVRYLLPGIVVSARAIHLLSGLNQSSRSVYTRLHDVMYKTYCGGEGEPTRKIQHTDLTHRPK